LSRTVTGKYYASLLHEDGQEAPAPIQSLNAVQVLGLDMGLTHIAIDSNGTKKPNPRFLKKASANLRRKQKPYHAARKAAKVVQKPDLNSLRRISVWRMLVLIFSTSCLDT